ncbi:hypothetical protein [Granulicella arctica]|uniref:Uncharacterized protein n=1 Tax=Granulicella arctica TaxID=940613 RepID=A0A7Y9PE47_9BACT|nr:hypothetical protein [Granulicella arctica]NYF78199.1 hypothetical protein [Granulicella arctica]
MKITSLKGFVAKAVTVGVLAGACVIAVPTQAQAEQFAVGVQVGYPYYGPHVGYYDFHRREEFRRREFGRYHYHAPYCYR